MSITDKQLKYLVILMEKTFGNYRKIILKEKYNVNSTSELDKDTASSIIEKLVNNDIDYISECKEIALIKIGQRQLF